MNLKYRRNVENLYWLTSYYILKYFAADTFDDKTKIVVAGVCSAYDNGRTYGKWKTNIKTWKCHKNLKILEYNYTKMVWQYRRLGSTPKVYVKLNKDNNKVKLNIHSRWMRQRLRRKGAVMATKRTLKVKSVLRESKMEAERVIVET